MNGLAHRQRGSALIAALFLVIVLGALGAYAARVGTDQQLTTHLQMQQYRALHAANAGLEYWSYRVNANPNTACPAGSIAVNVSATPGMRGFAVAVRCTRIVSGSQVVYTVTSTASTGTFGTPTFVQRQSTRQISNLGVGSF